MNKRETGSKKAVTRVVLNIPNELYSRIGELAADRGIAKSQMLLYCVSFYLDYHKNMTIIPSMIEAMKSLPSNVKPFDMK